MPKEESIPVSIRLSPDVLKRLTFIADRSGLSRSSVIKVLVNSFLEKVGNEPISGHALQAWEEAIRDLDGRTHRLSVAEKKGAYVAKKRIKPRGK